MKPTCEFYRNWEAEGLPHWCICKWKTCDVTGDECKAFSARLDCKTFVEKDKGGEHGDK